jgi:type II secretory pathway pseudopilin PulG
MKLSRGFILIELISVIVLIGIIASFTGFFLYTGINGYMSAKTNAEGSLNAQMALDRISLELKDLNYFTSPPDTTSPDLSIAYKSETLTGTRMIKYNSAADTIFININGTDYKLLENVTPCEFIVTPMDLDNDPSEEEVASIELRFKLGIGSNYIGKEFKAKIFPRHMVKNK